MQVSFRSNVSTAHLKSFVFGVSTLALFFMHFFYGKTLFFAETSSKLLNHGSIDGTEESQMWLLRCRSRSKSRVCLNYCVVDITR